MNIYNIHLYNKIEIFWVTKKVIILSNAMNASAFYLKIHFYEVGVKNAYSEIKTEIGIDMCMTSSFLKNVQFL